MSEEELIIAARTIEEYTAMIDRIQQEADRLKAEVKEHMRTHGLTEIEVDGLHIRLQETHRNHLDVKTFAPVPVRYARYPTYKE